MSDQIIYEVAAKPLNPDSQQIHGQEGRPAGAAVMRAIIPALAVLALTACGSPEPAAAPTVTATVTATATATATATVTASAPAASSSGYGLAKDGTSMRAPVVADVEELRTILTLSGLTCPNWTVIVEGFTGDCDGFTQLNAFPDNEAGRSAHRSAVNLSFLAISTQNRPDVALLVGPNWFVRADTEGAYVLRDLVGGSVIGLGA